jgi:hypothetical protein
MSLIDNGAHWRARAEESRSTADCMIDAGCAGILRSIADDYDRIARWCEGMVASGPAQPSRSSGA